MWSNQSLAEMRWQCEKWNLKENGRTAEKEEHKKGKKLSE